MKQKLLKKMGLIILVVSLFTSFAVMITNMLLDTCSIKYITFGGNMFIEEVVRGTKITLDNSITRDGYDFIGWTIGEDSNIVSEIVVKNDTILVANWKVVEHSIYYNNANYKIYNNAIIHCDGNTISFLTTEGNTVTLCGAKDYEWKLSDVNGDSVITESMSVNYAKSSAIYLTQSYRGETLNVTIEEKDGFSVNLNSIEVLINNNAIFEVVLDEGYTNSDIYLEGVDYSAICTRPSVYVVTIYNVTNDLCIDILGVQKNTYKVLLDFDGGVGLRCLDEYELKHGEKLYLPVPKKQGYEFRYWIDTKTNIVIDTIDILVTDNMTLKAIYTLASYTVSLPISTSGSYVTSLDGVVITDTNNNIKLTMKDSIVFGIAISEMYDSASVKLYYMIGDTRIDVPVVINGLNVSATISNVSFDAVILVDTLNVKKYTINIDYNGGVDSDSKRSSTYILNYGSFVLIENNVITFIDYISGIRETMGEVTKLGSVLTNYICNGSILVNSSVQSLGGDTINIAIQWNMVEGVVTLNSNGGTFEDGSTKLVVLAKDYSETIIPKKLGYTFVGWYIKLIEVNGVIDESLSLKLDNIDLMADTVVYAGWVQNI